jgi:hypothetical protein
LWTPLDAASPWPWIIAAVALVGGFVLFRATWRLVGAAWDRASAEIASS